MNKLLIVCALIPSVFAGVSSRAADENVEITSFIMAGSRTRAAEVCGKVSGMTGEWLAVRITVDPKSDRPGIYNTLAGTDGRFCTTVVTYFGQAEASIGWGAKTLSSDTAELTTARSR